MQLSTKIEDFFLNSPSTGLFDVLFTDRKSYRHLSSSLCDWETIYKCEFSSTVRQNAMNIFLETQIETSNKWHIDSNRFCSRCQSPLMLLVAVCQIEVRDIFFSGSFIVVQHIQKREEIAITAEMPFMKGKAPIRRTLNYLNYGKLVLKNEIKVFCINYNLYGEHHKGAKAFAFWHLPQIQFKNPNVQVLTLKNLTPSPFIRCFFGENPSTLISMVSVHVR